MRSGPSLLGLRNNVLPAHSSVFRPHAALRSRGATSHRRGSASFPFFFAAFAFSPPNFFQVQPCWMRPPPTSVKFLLLEPTRSGVNPASSSVVLLTHPTGSRQGLNWGKYPVFPSPLVNPPGKETLSLRGPYPDFSRPFPESFSSTSAKVFSQRWWAYFFDPYAFPPLPNLPPRSTAFPFLSFHSPPTSHLVN